MLIGPHERNRVNEHPERLKVGDAVVTDFYRAERNVVRRLVRIEPNGYSQSLTWGYTEPPATKDGKPLDLAWFIPVAEVAPLAPPAGEEAGR